MSDNVGIGVESRDTLLCRTAERPDNETIKKAWNRPLTPSVLFDHSLWLANPPSQSLIVSLSSLSVVLHKSETGRIPTTHTPRFEC